METIWFPFFFGYTTLRNMGIYIENWLKLLEQKYIIEIYNRSNTFPSWMKGTMVWLFMLHEFAHKLI